MNAIRNTNQICATLALSTCVLFISSARLSAGTLVASQIPKITIGVVGVSNPWSWTPPMSSLVPSTDSEGAYKLNSELIRSGIIGSTTNVTVKDLEFNSDPFVLNNILVTNTTLVTQIYSVTVGLPTSFGGPNLIKGSVTTSAIDGDTGGATVSTVAGQPIYKALIDFGQVATLQNDPFSVVAPGGGSLGSTSSFGLNPNGVAVLSNIGIQLTFQLTAGDTASILSRFDVVVPEPSSIALSVVVAAFVFGTARRSYRG